MYDVSPKYTVLLRTLFWGKWK